VLRTRGKSGGRLGDAAAMRGFLIYDGGRFVSDIGASGAEMAKKITEPSVDEGRGACADDARAREDEDSDRAET
jgi:hypothetical protein